jgi:hypothetical protein
MENLIEDQVIDVLGNLVVGGIKSIARHNKTGAAIVNKMINFDKNIREHCEFMDSIIEVLKPAMHLSHEIIGKYLPGYVHIVDLAAELCKDVYQGLVAQPI